MLCYLVIWTRVSTYNALIVPDEGGWKMLDILIFRLVFLLAIMIALFFFGDWKNLKKYYPTMLFVMVVNLTVSLLTYHHVLWNFPPDYLVKTNTVVEMLNSYFALPATVFIYLSNFPSSKTTHQCVYMTFWVLIYSVIELIDYIIGGITYQNGWSWKISTLFDFAIFSFTRIHYSRPLLAWILTFFLGTIILILFNFDSAEMK